MKIYQYFLFSGLRIENSCFVGKKWKNAVLKKNWKETFCQKQQQLTHFPFFFRYIISEFGSSGGGSKLIQGLGLLTEVTRGRVPVTRKTVLN